MNNKIQDAFSDVHASSDLKLKTFEKIVSNKKTYPMVYKLSPVFALLVLTIVSVIYFTPVSFISIDINPSVELEINSFGRVISVKAVNEDAKALIEDVNLTHLSYLEAIELLDSSNGFEEYSDSHTEITVISSNEDETQKIIENINDSSFSSGGNVECYSGDSKLKEEADLYDISFGKYRAYLELLALNPDINVDDIKDLPMKAINDIIDNGGVFDKELLPERGENSKGDNQGTGNGSGEGQGEGLGNGGEGQGNEVGSGGKGGGQNQGSGSGNGNGEGQGTGLGNGGEGQGKNKTDD